MSGQTGFRPCRIGLHKIGTGGEVGLTFSFHYKNALFIAVDEYASAISADSPTISPAAMEWLRAQMAAFNRPHVFAYAHAPAYEVWDSKAKNGPFTKLKDGLAVAVTGRWRRDKRPCDEL